MIAQTQVADSVLALGTFKTTAAVQEPKIGIAAMLVPDYLQVIEPHLLGTAASMPYRSYGIAPSDSSNLKVLKHPNVPRTLGLTLEHDIWRRKGASKTNQLVYLLL